MAAIAPAASSLQIKPSTASSKVAGAIRPGLRAASADWAKKTVSNATHLKTRQMLVWNPFDNKKYETFSYLPALNDQEISRQVDYITRNGWVPCLEFAEVQQGYVSSENCDRMGSVASLYYDNRYWTMWKLPMFGCSDPGQVLAEVQNCRKAFPSSYSRLVAFDPIRQVQICSFVVNHPELSKKKNSFGAEVSSGIDGAASSSSSSYSAAWDTSSSKTNDWSYTWDKNDSSTSSWDNSSNTTTDWSYDWNKGSDTSSSSSWGSSSGSSSYSSSSYSSGEDAELKRTMEEVQRKLEALKASVNSVIDKVDTPASSSSYGSSWNREDAVSSLERSYGSNGRSGAYQAQEKKDTAWNSW